MDFKRMLGWALAAILSFGSTQAPAAGLFSSAKFRVSSAHTYDTFNPADNAGTVLTGGNLIATANSGGGGVRSKTSKTNNDGKFYLEVTVTVVGGTSAIGLAKSSSTLYFPGYLDANSIGWASNGIVYNNGGTLATWSTYATGDVLGITIDTVQSGWQLNGYKNNVFQGSINLSVNGVGHDPSFIMWGADLNAGGSAATLNTGATPFVYAIPSGFTKWSP